jgi:general secretion pathway protein K
MITVLWVMTVGAIVAAAGTLAGRNSVNGAINRVHLERAFWMTTGSLARVEWAIDSALGASKSVEDAAATWRVLQNVVIPSQARDLQYPECLLTFEAAGTRLDLNAASDTSLRNLFVALGRETDADALTAALEDWRDSDDVARPGGAERDWYAAERREVPRNAPLADVRELHRVRGFEQIAAFAPFLTTETGRVSLATASVPVLRSVPGFTRETADRIAGLQAASTPPADVTSLLGMVSPASADSLRDHFPEIMRMTTPDPDAWILAARCTVGSPPVSVTLAHRLLRAEKRAVVVSSRSEP